MPIPQIHEQLKQFSPLDIKTACVCQGKMESNDLTYDQTQPQNVETAEAPRETKRGAARMAGFMFWLSSFGVIILAIGYVAPGWLTADMRQLMYYSSYSDESFTYKHVLQDYGLWYITQCDMSNEMTLCETLSYRLVEYAGACSDCKRFEIGDMERTRESKFLAFSKTGLVFNMSEIKRMQALYTIGLLLAIATLHAWYLYRKEVAETGVLKLNKKRWAFMLLLAISSALFVVIPVAMFDAVSGEFGDRGAEVKTSVGSVFAGFGAAIMVLNAVAVFLLVCCRNASKLYICNCCSCETEEN